jgi:hypothetical protein
MPPVREVARGLEALQKLVSRTKLAAREAEQMQLFKRGIAPGKRVGGVAERLQRAENMGYDVANPVYHGGIKGSVDHDILSDTGGHRIFLTTPGDIPTARSYAEHANSYSDAGSPAVLPFFLPKDFRVADATYANIDRGALKSAGGEILLTEPYEVVKGLEGKGVLRQGAGKKLLRSIGPGYKNGQALDLQGNPSEWISPKQRLNQFYDGSPTWQMLEQGNLYDDVPKKFEGIRIDDISHKGDAHQSIYALRPDRLRSAFAEFLNPKSPSWLAGAAGTLGLAQMQAAKKAAQETE